MSLKLSPSTPAVPPLRRTRSQASLRKSSRHILSHSAWNRRLGSSFAFACSMVWNFRTLSDPVRPLSVAMPCSLSTLLPTQGPFPPPALPGFSSTTGLSATLPAQTDSRELPVRCVPHHPQGFPCCHLLPLPCVPASLPRRVRRGARVARFPLRLRPSPFLR